MSSLFERGHLTELVGPKARDPRTGRYVLRPEVRALAGNRWRLRFLGSGDKLDKQPSASRPAG